MHEFKAKLRRLAYRARDAQLEKDACSREICARFINQQAYRQAQTVMWYIHCRSEVRTAAAVNDALSKSGKRCAIPYCTKDRQGQNKLGLWLLEDWSELVAGTWGILEPPPARRHQADKTVDPESLDLVMVPGVAFDRNGGRLGNGAGYYDRLLCEVRPDTVLTGVCFESQLIDEIPMEQHDVYMDNVITERAIYNGKGR